jgi:DSF synthase
MSALHTLPTTLQPQNDRFQQLSTYFDERYGIAWGYMHSEPRPCFTVTLLDNLIAWGDQLRARIDDPMSANVDYLVMASSYEGVFNLGGDLHLFREAILKQDRERLYNYAKKCVEACYLNASHLSRPGLTSICLVQGDALGGGFECALSGNVLIAEKGCKMGFPEILFNLFPGMGALTLLGRRIGMSKAEQIILSGNIYRAEELHEMGVVDILAESGEGPQAVYDYVRRDGRARNGSLALRAARERVQPISYDELMSVTEIWVDAALRIEQKDLRMMERLVARQSSKVQLPDDASVPAGARLAG